MEKKGTEVRIKLEIEGKSSDRSNICMGASISLDKLVRTNVPASRPMTKVPEGYTSYLPRNKYDC